MNVTDGGSEKDPEVSLLDGISLTKTTTVWHLDQHALELDWSIGSNGTFVKHLQDHIMVKRLKRYWYPHHNTQANQKWFLQHEET